MRTKTLVLSIATATLLSSCGINSGLINQFTTYGSNTNVVLQEGNYSVVAHIKGEASANYFLGFGGTSKKDLVAQAKADLLQKADLIGKSRAIVHMSLERHHSSFGFGGTHTIIVSGTVVEFNK